MVLTYPRLTLLVSSAYFIMKQAQINLSNLRSEFLLSTYLNRKCYKFIILYHEMITDKRMFHSQSRGMGRVWLSTVCLMSACLWGRSWEQTDKGLAAHHGNEASGKSLCLSSSQPSHRRKSRGGQGDTTPTPPPHPRKNIICPPNK